MVLMALLAIGWIVWSPDAAAVPAPSDVPVPTHDESETPVVTAPGGVSTEPTQASEEILARLDIPFDPPPPNADASVGQGRVLGTVLWVDDRQPIADVTVRLEVSQALGHRLRAPVVRTRADGTFTFEPVLVSPYHLTSALGGSLRVVVVADTDTRVELLVPRGATVAGVVVDENGQPVAGASLWLSERNAADFGEIVGRSDARGTFRIASVHGTRWIGARARGYRGSALSLVEGRDASARRLEITLERNDARVRGFVRDPDGEPCAGAIVLASPPGEAKWRLGLDGTQQRTWAPITGTADGQGAFSLEGLPPGELRVRAHAPGWGKATATVEVPAGAVVEVVLDLPRPASVRGRVIAADGAPVRERAFLAFARMEIDAVWAFTDTSGAYEVLGVSPGEVEAEVWQGSRRALSTTLTLSSSETREWNPVLGASGALRGRVVDSRQAPLMDYSVIAFRDNRGLGETKTDRDGRFALEDLDAEVLTLRVGVQPVGGSARTRLTVLVVPDVVPPRDDLLLVVGDDRLPSVTVIGRVLRADGMPAAGAKFQLGGSDDRGIATAVVDAAGLFRLSQVLPGAYWLSVREPEHPTLFVGQRTLAAREEVNLGDLQLAAGGRVVVTPRFAPGVAESEIAIEVLDDRHRSVGNLQRAGASLRSPVVPAGSVSLVISGRTVARARHQMVVEAGRETHVDLVVDAGRRRVVRAALPAGAAVPRWVWGSVFGPEPGELLGGGGFERGEDGTWTLEVWLPARDCVVVVGVEGQTLRGHVSLPASLPDGAVVPVALQPPK